jgi:hypothetical protein
MDTWILYFIPIFFTTFFPSNNYMPPPVDDILGYHYYDAGAFLRLKKNTNIFDTPIKPRNSFPFAFGKTKVSLYTSPMLSNTIVYEYTVICLGGYLCTSKNNIIYHKKALITNVDLELLSVISNANVFKFIYMGIPEETLPDTIKKEIEVDNLKNGK